MSRPTYYVQALLGEYAEHAFDEERAPKAKAYWRQNIFRCSETTPLDLEIGTGNGYFFANQALKHPDRCLVGIEIKFKPLIQSIRRALNNGSKNARIVRYCAQFSDHLFSAGELDNVYVHHPDPWVNPRRIKHRLMRRGFLQKLSILQKPRRFIEFKTDSDEYFFWALEEFKNSPYKIFRYTENLHASEWSDENYVTHFERIFISKGQPIYYLRAELP